MLDGLVFDDAIWPRVSLDQVRVDHLADLLRANQQLPPIKIQKGTSVVLGGRHTAAACRLVGETSYLVEFVDVAPEERLLYAYREDVAAALPYSDADVQSVARRLYEQRCTNGDSPNVAALATDLGRSQRTVAHWVDDLVKARSADVELKRAARVVAVQAFRHTGLSTRRVAALVGVDQKQVRTDSNVAIGPHLADSRVVSEAHSLIQLAIGSGATVAETEAARDWLIGQTDPGYLEQREQRRLIRQALSDLQDFSERLDRWTLPADLADVTPVQNAIKVVLMDLKRGLHES
jgi:hypothetical protein